MDDPGRMTRRGLVLWGLALIGLGIGYAIAESFQASYAIPIIVGALTLLLAWRAARWQTALYRALFLHAFALVAAGVVTGLDPYIVGGVVSLVLLCLAVILEDAIRSLSTPRRPPS